MKHITKKYRSALIMQIILLQIHATYSIHHLTQRNYLQTGRNTENHRYRDPRVRDLYYNPHSSQMKDRPALFLRKAKSGNQPRLLNIDLSGLRQDKELPAIHTTSRHKSPMLGIDISALSRNPDPSLPIAIVHPKNILNGKSIMSYDFDFKYDRLPIIKAKPIRPILQPYAKSETVLPVMHIPLKVMTTYHSILTNKKDIDFDFNSGSSNDLESEQKYTANFILQLLYQLSSNYGKVGDD